jgi:hypothetical protein
MQEGDIFLDKIEKVFSNRMVLEKNGLVGLYGIRLTNFKDVQKMKNILKKYDQVVVQCIKIKGWPIVKVWPPWDEFSILSYDQKLENMVKNKSLDQLMFQ